MNGLRGVKIALFAFSALIYMLTAPGHLGTVDMRDEFAVSQSILRHGDFTVAPPLPYINITSVTGTDGRSYTAHGLGQSILLLPAAFIGVMGGCNASGCPPMAQHNAEFAASFLDGIAAAFAVVILFCLALEMGARVRASLCLALLFGFTTVEWAYAHDAFDVGPATTFVLFTLYALYRGANANSRRWLLAGGIAGGFAILIRDTNAISILIFGLYLLWRLRDQALSEFLRRSAAFGVPVVLFILFEGWYNWMRLGNPLETGYSLTSDFPGFSAEATPAGLAGFFLSPGRSIFLYSPILLAAFVGIPRFWREHRTLAITVFATVIGNLLFYSAFLAWWGAWDWGPRYLVPMTPLIMLSLLPVLERLGAIPRWARRGIWTLAGIGAAVQLLDISLDFQHQIQLMTEQGVSQPDAQNWSPQFSDIWRNVESWFGLFSGGVPYPHTFQFTDLATFRPLQMLFDTWWVYAWVNGVNPLVLGIALAGMAGGAVYFAKVLLQNIRGSGD